MKIEVNGIKNGFTVSLTNPLSSPETFFVPEWKQVLSLVNGLQVSDGPMPSGGTNIVPLVPPLNPKDDGSIQ